MVLLFSLSHPFAQLFLDHEKQNARRNLRAFSLNSFKILNIHPQMVQGKKICDICGMICGKPTFASFPLFSTPETSQNKTARLKAGQFQRIPKH